MKDLGEVKVLILENHRAKINDWISTCEHWSKVIFGKTGGKIGWLLLGIKSKNYRQGGEAAPAPGAGPFQGFLLFLVSHIHSAFVPVLTCRASYCWIVCIFAWFILYVQPWNEFHHNRDLIKDNFIIFLVAVPKVSDIVALTEFCYTLSLKNDSKGVCGLMVPLNNNWTHSRHLNVKAESDRLEELKVKSRVISQTRQRGIQSSNLGYEAEYRKQLKLRQNYQNISIHPEQIRKE